MARPRLLDLFCGAGGAAMGYYRAGFEVAGVDINPQKHYPFEFHQADALKVLETLITGDHWQGYMLADFKGIHASPVCKGYTRARGIQGKTHDLLIAPTRERLRASGLPWILENVVMTGKWRWEMPAAIEMCGHTFGLPIYRHRYFESSEMLFAPAHVYHPYRLLPGYVTIYGHVIHGSQQGNRGNKYTTYDLACGRAAMGIDWPMTRDELSQAIPPAYTEWLGRQLMVVVEREQALATAG